MKLAFRADASIEIGVGHVMRCLTLAQYMSDRGHECIFICCDLPGNNIKRISASGFQCYALPLSADLERDAVAIEDQYAPWLGWSRGRDVALTSAVLEETVPDLLVVDHYALEQGWERQASHYASRVMIMDDLANRSHDCDILLDQNLGKRPGHYQGLVPERCEILAGSMFALLRPEFVRARSASVDRRNRLDHGLRHILISMGGVDKLDYTGRVLAILNNAGFLAHIKVTVILGIDSPHKESIATRVGEASGDVSLLVDADAGQVAAAMAEADLAIGAAGTTSWERCCLGLPTLLLVMAENQKFAASELTKRGAGVCLEATSNLEEFLVANIRKFSSSSSKLREFAMNASRVTYGNGSRLVAETIERVCG